MAEKDDLLPVVLLLFLFIIAGIIIALIVKGRDKSDKKFTDPEDYIKNVNSNANANNVNNFNLDEMQQYMREAYAATCLIPPEEDGTCRAGSSKNDETGCCELNDAQGMSEFEKGLKMTETIVASIFISYMIEKFVSVANKMTGLAARRVFPKAAKSAGRVAAKSTARIAMRNALKMGAKVAAKPVAWVGGPLSFMWLAFEAWSLYLDIKDPRGYTKLYQPADIVTKMRNNIDVVMEKKMNEVEDSELRLDYPQCFPLSQAFPEYDDEFQTKYFSHFLPTALESMTQEQQGIITNYFLQLLLGDRESTEEEDNEASKVIEDVFETVTSANYMERDEFIHEFYKNRVGSGVIMHSKEMSSPRRVGVTLSQLGAEWYNSDQKYDHLRYSNLQDENNCASKSTSDLCQPTECAWDSTDNSCKKYVPETYSPYVAVYTNKYRKLDTSLASFESYDEENPPMIDVNLPEYTTLYLPYGALIAACVRGVVESGDEIVSPGDYQVTFNYERADCNYTGSYCQRFGLDYDSVNNECKMYPGQEEAEFVFGTTVTRDVIRVANDVGGFFEGFFTGKGGV